MAELSALTRVPNRIGEAAVLPDAAESGVANLPNRLKTARHGFC